MLSRRPTGKATPAPTESPRLLTHEEVMERARRFNELLERERELQEFLLKLKFRGDYAMVMEQRRQHDEALAEIDRIRMEGILPIVVELNEFLQAVKAEEAAKAAKSASGAGDADSAKRAAGPTTNRAQAARPEQMAGKDPAARPVRAPGQDPAARA